MSNSYEKLAAWLEWASAVWPCVLIELGDGEQPDLTIGDLRRVQSDYERLRALRDKQDAYATAFRSELESAESGSAMGVIDEPTPAIGNGHVWGCPQSYVNPCTCKFGPAEAGAAEGVIPNPGSVALDDHVLIERWDGPPELKAMLLRAVAEMRAGKGTPLEQVDELAVAPPIPDALLNETLADYLTRQWEWSRRTFGEGYRLSQLRKHIDSELLEIGTNPGDPVEWLDLALLALDGAQRFAGLTPDQVMPMLIAKQQKNFARTWPTPVSEDEAVEHDRSGE